MKKLFLFLSLMFVTLMTAQTEQVKHGLKSNLCREKRIKLLHVREDLWIKDKEKMKNIIKNFLSL